jgi:hypothetical protein
MSYEIVCPDKIIEKRDRKRCALNCDKYLFKKNNKYQSKRKREREKERKRERECR